MTSALLAGGTVRRSDGVLADGREIFYYDDSEPYVSGGASRHVADTRELPPATGGARVRRDPLTGDWVAIASHRNTRTFRPPANECPLDPTRPGRAPTEVPAPDYDVVVFENRFPSFSLLDPGTPMAAPRSQLASTLWPEQAGQGHCDVVLFTAQHDSSFSALSSARVRTVIEAWIDRTQALSAIPTVRQVFPFENRGQEIGVTLEHPHGQIYGYPFITPRTQALLREAGDYRARTGGNLLADVLDAEREAEVRVVFSTQHWTAYVPAAARWPVEVHLAPHRDVPDLAALDDAERAELSTVYLDLLGRMDRYFDQVESLPYIAGWHQAPTGPGRELGRLHMQLFSVLRAPGKLKYLAGSESAMGAWINDAVPERIAERLRDVAPS